MIARVVKYQDPREARSEGSQFRDQRSPLHLREFAKNSRIFKAFAETETTLAQFSSLVDRSFRTALAFDKLMTKL